MYEHHCRTNGKPVSGIGELDERPCHQMVQAILGEVITFSIEDKCMEELVEVVSKFEHVVVIKICWNLLTRIVLEKLWFSCTTSHANIEKVAVILS